VADPDDEVTLERDPEVASDDDPTDVEVPYDQLSPEALLGVIKEFVTREGTDYGHVEITFEAKIEQVRRQLERGEVLVLFDAKAETINLVSKRDARR
jgi:hypothetical protein